MIRHLTSKDGKFMLSYPDLYLGNIFINEDFNITSIIDWGSASLSPMTELLATLGLSGLLSRPKESLTTTFRSGLCQGG